MICIFKKKSKHVKWPGTTVRVFEKVPGNQPGDLL